MVTVYLNLEINMFLYIKLTNKYEERGIATLLKKTIYFIC